MEHRIPDATKIHVEEHETRTNTHSMMLQKIRPWLDKANIEYKVLTGEEIPDDYIQGWHFRGRTGVRHTAVIVSHLNSEELLAAIEELYEIPEEDLEKAGYRGY